MGPRRIQFQLTILFILVSHFWEERWIAQANILSLKDGEFDSSDNQIETGIVIRRHSFSDVSADECTDFYKHVCGRASDSGYLIPKVLGKESWRQILNARLEALISADITPRDEPAVRKVKQQYQLCMNYDQRDNDASEALKMLILKYFDFPMITSRESWNPLAVRILEPQKYDPSLFSIRVRDNKIYIDKYDVSAYGGFLSNLKNVSGISHSVMYKLKLKQLLGRIGLVDGTREDSFDRDLNAVMNFRRDLHRIARIRAMVHSRITVANLQSFVSINHEDWPRLDWLSFLQNVFINATEVEINSNTEVYVEIAYFAALKDLMLRYSPRCIANHIALHFFETYIVETSRPLIKISKELSAAAYDTIELHFRKSSSNPCIHQPHILRALNYMYLKKWFSKQSRNAALNMVTKIKESLLDYFRATGMISYEAIQSAKDLIQSVNVIVGSEEKYIQYNFLDPLYKYEVPDEHLSSVVNARRYFKEYEYSTLAKPKDTSLTRLAILEDIPYVSVEEDIVYMPIGYLHRASLSPTLPLEISYATIGYKLSLFLNEMVIKKGFPWQKFSRELTWYGGDPENFMNKTACFEKQYNLRFPKGKSTRDKEIKKYYEERLGRYVYDNAAFQVLYSAFKSTLWENKIAEKEDLFTDSCEKEFLNNWTNNYCEYDMEDRHNPSPLRVNNVLRNSNAFHVNFNCTDKEFMNPRNKCIFWG